MKTKHLLNLAGGLLMSAFGHTLHAQTYCTPPTSNCGLDDEIQNITFAGINNSSTCTTGGYADYTAGTPATVMAGNSYSISVTVGPGGNEAIAAWIDYDHNGVFDASEYTYIGNIEDGTTTATINIPVSATTGSTRMRIRSFYIASGDPATIYSTTANSSCAAISTNFGETEDYLVNITGATACSGVPSTITATATASSICVGTSFSLSASVTPANGLSYQWQSSTDGGTTWNNLGTAQAFANYSVTGQTQTTQYRLVLTCSNGGASVTSSTVTVTQNAASACYCTPVLDCTDDDMILNVTFGAINNNSTCSPNGYANYTAMTPAALQTTLTYPISVTVGDGWSSESVSVWIDYNHDGNFDASEFTYIGTGSGSAVTGSVTVPSTALTGPARMRVRVAAVGSLAATDDMACDEIQEYGETEDYMVTISVVTTCSGVPATLAATATESEVCTNTSFSLNTDATPQDGYSYQWQSSADGGTTWNNLGAAQTTTSSYSVPSQTATTQYRLVLTCINGGASVTSNVVTVTQNPITECFCIPVLDCTDDDMITNVTFGTINNNSTCSVDGYEDYTSITPAAVETSQSYPISVTVGSGWADESVSVWIDYDHSGTFDASEFTYVGTGSGSVVSGTIAIPPTAMAGNARMRVRVAAVALEGATDDLACDEEQVYGETEDYLVNITVSTTNPDQVDSVVVTTQGNVPAVIPVPTGTLQVVATVYPSTVSQDVTWSVINVTGTATISATGLVTAQAAGTVWAKAVSVEDVTKKDSILITINPIVTGVDSVVVTTQGNIPAAISTQAGTLQLVATVYPSTQSQQVTWSIIPGGTGAATISATGLVTAQANGFVWAKAVSVANATKSDSIQITITNQDLGFDDLFAGSDLSVFPNPTSDLVKVQSTMKHGALQIRVTDVAGNVLSVSAIQENALNEGQMIDLSGFAPGMYFITLDGSGSAVTRSVIRR